MLSYDEALQQILAAVPVCPSAEMPLLECRGAVLAEDVVSPIPLPPFSNSAMDGYAVCAADIAEASDQKPVSLQIVEEMIPGKPPSIALQRGQAIKINTGGPIPDGADAIVPVEDTRQDERPGLVGYLAPQPVGSYVRPAGEDLQAGEVAITRDTFVRAAEIAMAAAVGRAALRVVRPPRVAVISTGSELAEPGPRSLQPGQIYNSNLWALASQVLEAGATLAAQIHAVDDAGSLRQALDEAAGADADVIVTSGGVSVGGYDLVRDVFAERGKVDFWRVAIRPGKPLAFGHWGRRLFFGLPGNPASSMVTFELFVRPALRKMRGLADFSRPTVEARLLQDVHHEPGRRSFVRALTSLEDGGYVTEPAGKQGSHLLLPMVAANSLLVLPEDVSVSPAGSFVTALLLDN